MDTASATAAAMHLWRRLIGAGDAGGEAAAYWPGRGRWLDVLTPALCADLAPELDLDAEAVRQGRLYGRYQQERQLQALGWIEEAGVACVAIKGFASAFLYYPSPPSRLIGDLDLLLRAADLERAVAALQARGFRFGGMPAPAWGFIGDASFVPLHSPDRDCNVDLHVQPDSYPLHVGLDVDLVFARARSVLAGGRPVAVPSAEHLALILVSNLAKDKFAPSGLRKLLDLGRLLRHEHELDRATLAALARSARLGKALATATALLAALGTPQSVLPSGLALPGGRIFAELLADWIAQRPPTLSRQIAREWRLAAEPRVAARLAWRRARGLVRARSGMPEPPAS